MAKIKVVHYVNQFYAGIGGEEKADITPELRVGTVPAGDALNKAWGEEAEITHTIICGDSYFGENMDKASAEIMEMVKSTGADMFIAGPAFNAGRYGVACGTIATNVKNTLGIPVLTGMYVENPGADMYKTQIYIVDYRIYAFEDTNNNMQYEPSVDQIGFLDSVYNPDK